MTRAGDATSVGVRLRSVFILVLLAFAGVGAVTLMAVATIHAHGGGDDHDPFHDDEDDGCDDDEDDDDDGGDGHGGAGNHDDDDDGGGRDCPDCFSSDATNSPGCYKHRSDPELSLLLAGNAAHPFPLPRACGEVVETPAEARAILGNGGSAPCSRFRRDALAALFNIRRSILFGDGRLGDDGAECFRVADFRIVLRCGSFKVPDPSTQDPGDAITVTEKTPLLVLVTLANQLCELASCPGTNGATCGKTIGRIAEILNQVNSSRKGECSLCRDDRTPPVISCPQGVLEFECRGPAGAPIHYTVTATDDCDPHPAIFCFPPPGTVLPAGTLRTVECKAKDLSGNYSKCSFKVKVVDRTPPAITCPEGPIVVDCLAGGAQNGAVVNYPPPSAADVCDATPALTCTPPSGSLFPFGTTTVTCTAMDDAGNTSRCTFDVIVVADSPPALVCPADITVECAGPGGAIVEYPPPMVTQTCQAPSGSSCSPPSGSLFPIGSTIVTCTTRNGQGNITAQCQFTVTVRDRQPPSLTCPADASLECAGPGGTPFTYQVTATDACDPAPAVHCEPPPGSLFPPGETTVTCTATDDAGNASSSTFKVIVADTRPPEILCPEAVVASCLTNGPNPGAIVHYPAPMAMDACDPELAVACTPPPGSFFPLGTTLVSCTVEDAAGNAATCSFEVRVTDQAPPDLVCVASFTAECTGPEGATIEYPVPVVADDCSGQVTVNCTPPSGSTFPFGTTPVTCTATDGAGNEISCSFDVTVEDQTPPAITCPPDRNVECETPDGTRVEFVVTAADLCDPAPAIACDPPSGTVFPAGLTVVECSATDASGNTSTCRFTVSVVDTRPPLIECPPQVTAECQSPAGTNVTYTVSAIDACGAPVTVACDPPSGSLFPPGTTAVTCTATDDSGNSSTCTFQVVVADTTPPSITCPSAVITIECTGEGGARANYPPPAVADACDQTVEIVCLPPPDAVLPVGRHPVTCRATDGAGNSATCSFEIVVADTAPPSLNCIEDLRRECEGPDGARVEYQDPTPTDTCDPAPNLSCLPPSGSVFPIGETIVTCTADDSEGNMVSCSFKVTVADSMPPLIQCPSSIVAPCTAGAGTAVSYVVTATDLCDPTPIVTCDPPSGSVFQPGTSKVTCTARDRYGNASTCTFDVTVRDDAPPAIVCPEAFARPCAEGGSAVVEYPPPEVTDDCDPAPEVVCVPPSGTRLPPGAHDILCTATDAAGNESSCEFRVTVVDEGDPELVCPPAKTADCEGPGGTTVTYEDPIATDACDASPTVTCVPPSGSLFPLGETEVVCTAEDAAGNTIQCTFTVTVRDTTPPAIACPESIVASAQSAGGATVDFTIGAEDACDPSVQVTCEPPPGSLFPLGQTPVVCRAEDAAGNEATCTFTVTVADRTAPAMSCLADLIVQGTTAGEAPHKPPGWPPGSLPPPNAITGVVIYADPAATDGEQAEPPQITCSPPSGTRLGFGRHTVTCRARDRAGNERTCTFEVNVVLGTRAFIRGDANQDSKIDIGDPIWCVNNLFLSGPRPRCLDAADANDDGRHDLTDVIYELNYIFQGGPRIPGPAIPFCGLDPTETDPLGCERYLPCE